MRKLFVSALLSLSQIVCFAQSKDILLRQWNFSRDSINWEKVTVPHDWAISGPFDKKWDLQTVAIVQNGETEATEKSGRSGALPWIGKGYYRTTVELSTVPENAELRFDGAMADAHVWVNGQFVGNWPYGYNAFRLNVSHALKPGENTIEVSLNNLEESSRWYPGGGLYRPVELFLSGKQFIDDWSTQFIPVVDIKNDKNPTAIVYFKTTVKNGSGYSLNVVLHDRNGKSVGRATDIKTDEHGYAETEIALSEVHLWSPESPYLYNTTVSLIDKDGSLCDSRDFKVGVKKVEINSNGFYLNGEPRKFKGVCMHHDLGPLGAAVNKSALIRQAQILKDMGCDAIRTSHNMPSTMQMEVYDSLGIMVMAESFDMWRQAKCKNGYARNFDKWADRDITNLVLNHRNHASLVMWSIGNEVPEQRSDNGWGTRQAIHLQDIIHRLDCFKDGRAIHPVTQGCEKADVVLANGFIQSMDVPGFNYHVHCYDDGLPRLPQQFILGSETSSTVSSRGVYKFPVVLAPNVTHPDAQCSSYDTEYCGWSNVPDDDFLMQDDRDWTIGQFVWTGFDYLGEPTPYDEYWPARSSYFGICDLAGLPKDRYYLYRSVWNTNDHTIHLLPHWTWPERVGEVTPVYCYTDYPEAELFINGKSQGRIKKQTDQRQIETSGITSWNAKVPTEEGVAKAKKTSVLDRYRLRWNDVRYEPGEVRVVCYDEYGNQAGEKVIRTAEKPKSLILDGPDSIMLNNDDPLAYITVSLVDKNGTLIPDASDNLEITVKGAGTFRALCNGDATSTEVFTEPHMRLFNGQLVATIATTGQEGIIEVIVNDKTRRIKAKKQIICCK